MSEDTDLTPGVLLGRNSQGTQAVYRVLAQEEELVAVEVVLAPGLEPGTVERLHADDAAAMALLPPAEEPAP